ncbi:MAG: zf-HC2 domain-containing protein [Acidobacteriota bacterium]
MRRRHWKHWIEEYVERSLPEERTRHVEEHLSVCTECREYLHLILRTRTIVRDARLEGGPVPTAGFARRVMDKLEQQRESNLFWRPLGTMAMKAVPIMAAAALLLAILAYREWTPQAVAEVPPSVDTGFLEIYLDLPAGWGREAAVFSEAISQDQDRAVESLIQDRAPELKAGEEGKQP